MGGDWAGVLASTLPYGPALCEHILRLGGLDPNRDTSQQPLSPQECESLIAGAGQWEAWLDGCEVNAPKGFIFTRSTGSTPAPPLPPSSSLPVLVFAILCPFVFPLSAVLPSYVVILCSGVHAFECVDAPRGIRSSMLPKQLRICPHPVARTKWRVTENKQGQNASQGFCSLPVHAR